MQRMCELLMSGVVKLAVDDLTLDTYVTSVALEHSIDQTARIKVDLVVTGGPHWSED